VRRSHLAEEVLHLMTLKTSCKVLGKYERQLMEIIVKHFELQGFTVIPHTRFNIAWSNLFSDIDILMLKDGFVHIIEIKSHRDRLVRAFRQIDKIQDFADFVYIATETVPRSWNKCNIGLLVVDLARRSIDIVHEPQIMRCNPRIQTVSTFQRKCLNRTLAMHGVKKEWVDFLYKQQLAELVLTKTDPRSLRYYLKEIATCGRECENDCPIWNFDTDTPPI
jgi:Holliday junction resolvase-like predicted endonuclease